MAIAGRTMGLAAVLALCAAATPVESWIDAPGPAGALKGVLLTPAKPGPALLIIPGSGPTDHDGNSPAGLRAGTYRLLAEGLAAHGITSLRIDKRGLFASRAAVPDANAVTIGDYAADVHAWIGVLRARTGQSCVWLLGHSEGGLVALVAADGRPDVCGVVLVATPGRPYGEVLRAQLHANPANAPLLAQADGAIDALEAGRHYDTAEMHPALRPLFRPAVQGFLISAFAVDPVKRVAGLRVPVLILQGGRDLQVDEDDARALARAAPGARLVVLSGANHVLKPVPADDRGANLASYADPALPLAPGVVEAIADFAGRRG